MNNNVVAVVLAAGKGTRMKSDLPKVLVEVSGRPMIHWVLDALEKADVGRVIVVVGYRADDVRRELSGRKGVEFVDQTQQLGTGHAVKVCRDSLQSHQGAVLIVTGDSPMVQADSLKQLLSEFKRRKLSCLLGTLHHPSPTGLGRILRDPGSNEFSGIVEEKDASPEQRAITEVNMSTYVFDCGDLLWSLEQIENNNQQREYYLTDCPAALKKAGKSVDALPILKPCESLSINTADELHRVEDEMRKMGYSI